MNMKKLIIVLIVLSFLTSCGNKNQESNTEIWDTLTWLTETWITDNEIDNKDNSAIVDNTGADDSSEINNQKNNSDNWTTSKDKNNNNDNPKSIEWNSWVSSSSWWSNTKDDSGISDDAALEKEVNDLLDDFIDSLDNYDKQ